MRAGALVVIAFLAACAGVRPAQEPRPAPGTSALERGVASYYADSLAGRSTASGEPYRPREATCAHRRHALGTRLEITVVMSGRAATCRVNDRGPFVKGRVVDVSRAVAERLGLLQEGLLEVELRPLQ